jgi:hypothetical protein
LGWIAEGSILPFLLPLELVAHISATWVALALFPTAAGLLKPPAPLSLVNRVASHG